VPSATLTKESAHIPSPPLASVSPLASVQLIITSHRSAREGI